VIFTDFHVGEKPLGTKVMEAIEIGVESLTHSPFADPLETFQRVRGHILFAYAKWNSMKDYEFIQSALLIPMLIPKKAEDFERFRLESGLAYFCDDHAVHIRNAVLQQFHEGEPVGYEGYTRWSEYVGANLPSYCPDLLNQFPELVPVVIAHRMYASVVDSDPSMLELGSIDPYEVSMHGSQEIDGYSGEHAFTYTINAIMDHDPVALRFHISGGEYRYPLREGRAFVSDAAEEIFTVPESIYFKDAGDGVIEILATGELAHFEAIGRFIGLSLAHDVSLGVRFPESYVSLFIGRDVEISFEPEVKARLELMVKGFQAVVPPILIGDFITVERLERTFLGTPVINVVDLIANIRFRFTMDYDATDSEYSGWLKNYLHTLSQQDLKKFTRLLCGRSVGPIGGFGANRPHMSVKFRSDTLESVPFPIPIGRLSTIGVPFYRSQEELIERFNKILSDM
jgi:hypothetical protein